MHVINGKISMFRRSVIKDDTTNERSPDGRDARKRSRDGTGPSVGSSQ
jgi:hypothetical protein